MSITVVVVNGVFSHHHFGGWLACRSPQIQLVERIYLARLEGLEPPTF